MKRRREPLTPDITPLVDVVFLLLIFFLVSTAFKKEELALLLNLPKAGEAAKEVELKEITIELSKDSVALNGKKMNLELIDTKLSLIEIKNKNDPIMVRIDKNIKYERVIKLFNILKKHGLENLALINETQSK